MVVAMAGSAPLKNALVTLNSVDDRSRAEVTIRSEGDGHFLNFAESFPGNTAYELRKTTTSRRNMGSAPSNGPGSTLNLQRRGRK